jgi:hypothetical protein
VNSASYARCRDVKERIAAYAEAGVPTLLVQPLGSTADERVDLIIQVRELTA